MSSDTPSAKYSCSASPLRLTKGSTASAGPFRDRRGRLAHLASPKVFVAGVCIDPDAMNADMSRNVLDGLFAHIFETEVELVSHLIVHYA